MPTRFGTICILLFWLITMGYVGYRDIWPQLMGDAAPRVWIDFSDEATQAIPTRWSLYKDKTRIGTVLTQMSFDARTEQFHFTTKYRDLVMDVEKVKAKIPEAVITAVVDRAGQLKAQNIKLSIVVQQSGFDLAAEGKIESVVQDGVLTGICHVTPQLFPSFEQALEPTPVTQGQVINPLQPVNRLRGVKPGMRFTIHESNPLGDAVAIMVEAGMKKYLGTSLLGGKKTERSLYIAEVESRPEQIARKTDSVDCWVISIRNERSTAKVWVRVSDGTVIRQVASSMGETLRYERED